MIGTTAPVFIPRTDDDGKQMVPGENYFFVKIHNAQAVYRGPIWQKLNRIIIASKVGLNHPKLGDNSVKAIQRYREGKRNQTSKLGLSPNLVSLVPATMTHITLSIDFLLDRQNMLFAIMGLINSDTFLSTLSFAPGASAIAAKVGTISDKLLQTLLQPEDQKPVLQFSGDFNIEKRGLQDGFYAILGTQDPNHPLPDLASEKTNFKIRNGELLHNGKPVENLCYVILEVGVVPARGRERNNGATWHKFLELAEFEAEMIGNDPFATKGDKKAVWEKCRQLIRKAREELNEDHSYTRKEAKAILLESQLNCRGLIFDNKTNEKGLEVLATPTKSVELNDLDLAEFGLQSEEELQQILADYAVEKNESKVRLSDLEME